MQNIFARLKHPVTESVTHDHTTLVITIDETGQYWLEARCRHDWCSGNLRLKLLPEQIEEWQYLY